MENVEMSRLPARDFWAKQRVMLTGHTGFKGSWLCLWLESMCAQILGVGLPPESSPNLFQMVQPVRGLESVFEDVRDTESMRNIAKRFRPTILIHMAAQPLVRRSFKNPLDTFSVNVMGTASVLEAVREIPDLKCILIVTTDKVYRNQNEQIAFTEEDPLGGSDPYSASKAAAELVASCWAQSFMESEGVVVATARAGNVLGGGDWSEDRLIPDIWRSLRAGRPVELRYPHATRPWQHVLECLAGYLVFMESLAQKDSSVPRALNFGPNPEEELTVSEVAEAIAQSLGATCGWINSKEVALPEKKALALNPDLAAKTLRWNSKMTHRTALAWTAEWYRRVEAGENARAITLEQIDRYSELS